MKILAHRGASGYAPENTFAAFELGRRQGAEGIETDIHATRDGVLVLIHDEKVDRTTDGCGYVREFSWMQLRQLDAGSKFSPAFAHERVPQLEEFLDRYAGQLALCLEVKDHLVIEPLATLLGARGFATGGGIELTSFEWDIAVRLHERLPHATVGVLVRQFDASSIKQVEAAGFQGICPHAKQVTPQLVAHAHQQGLTVRTWGVKSREDLQHVLTCGVDGTTLNWPDWIKRAGKQVTIVHPNSL